MLITVLLNVMIGFSVISLLTMILTLVTEKLGFGITFIVTMVLMITVVIIYLQ